MLFAILLTLYTSMYGITHINFFTIRKMYLFSFIYHGLWEWNTVGTTILPLRILLHCSWQFNRNRMISKFPTIQSSSLMRIWKIMGKAQHFDSEKGPGIKTPKFEFWILVLVLVNCMILSFL